MKTEQVVIGGVIVVGSLIVDAALLPGIVIGGVACLLPGVLPSLAPLARETVRHGYKFGRHVREQFAEAREQVDDIVAEVHAEATPDALHDPRG